MPLAIEPLPSQNLLDLCAKAWDLSDIVFVRKMENIVFACKSPRGKVYLRLTSPLRRQRKEIEAEIDWIEHLARWDLKVPQVVPDKKGDKIISFTENKQHFEAVVFGAVPGEHPSEEISTDPRFLKTLGALIAQMHISSSSYEGSPTGCKREEWFEERGLRHALLAASTSESQMLRCQLEKSIEWIGNLPKTPKTYGLIHADLGALNLFIGEDSSISVIDFDDSCYHFFVFDLAIVLFSMAARLNYMTPQPQEIQWLENLVEGYQTIRPLDATQIQLIPHLGRFAVLRIFFWIEYHEKLGTFHSDALAKVAKLKNWAVERIKNTLQ